MGWVREQNVVDGLKQRKDTLPMNETNEPREPWAELMDGKHY
jgi:hypothetical protein